MPDQNLLEERNADYRHYRIAGTPAELGAAMAAQAPAIAADEGVERMTAGRLRHARDCRALTAEIAPRLVEEIDAYADAQGLPRDALLWHYGLGVEGACSAVVVRSADGLVVARNYDFFYFESRRHLIETAPDQGLAHLGMHEGLAAGRFDGLNAAGLFVAFNGAGPHPDPAPAGMPFQLVVRWLLETCTSVAQARDLLLSLPLKEPKSYLLADAHDACVIEATPQRRAVRVLEQSGMLAMTNHFLSPEMAALCPEWDNSLARYRRLCAGAPLGLSRTATVEGLQRLMADHEAPLCGHDDGLATFWSAVAVPGNGEIRYSLGAPCRNPFQVFHVPA
ncbi:choloylglycine hydrolase [Chitiniphilus shinanonensis]|uniref:Choloylglycine hydrolase n=1 Tax=Chitiniphilus shinanonensis TaxID=553088 RepID=A0ABQ6BX56_9NEIS|nr:C45 family peptidase [Chitiniphilus shinanonensis]GLS06328.1 choloylglycine hydrolase [Chitiniphilus shinanonensis]